MSKYQFGSIVDRDFRLELQRMADYISGMGYTYEESLQKAREILEEAKQTNDMNESVQQQINILIAESGTSDAEVLQARIDYEGVEHPVLKERLDKSDADLSATQNNLSFAKVENAETKVYATGEATYLDNIDDGYIYGSLSTTLYRKIDLEDDWRGIVNLPANDAITGLRAAGDGEILVACSSDGIWKSSGWDADPFTATFSQVLVTNGTVRQYGFSADSTSGWVLVTTYINGDMSNSRYVWLSKDNGNTFTQVFDMASYEPSIDQTHAHMHVALIDSYHNAAVPRLWISYHKTNADPTEGTEPVKRIKYSDDGGVTWNSLTDSKYQPVCAIALPNGVLFGEDINDMGVYFVERKDDPSEMEYEWIYAIRGEAPGLFGWGTKAISDENGIAHLIFRSSVSGYPARIISTDGKNINEVAEIQPATTSDSVDFYNIVAYKGKLIGTYYNTSTGGGTPYLFISDLPERGANPDDEHTVSGLLGGVAGGGGVAAGLDANSGQRGSSVGHQSRSDRDGAAFGYQSQAGNRGTSIGTEASSTVHGVSSGYKAYSEEGVSIGLSANSKVDGIAIGGHAKAVGESQSMGLYSEATGAQSEAFGKLAKATGTNSQAIGALSQASGTGSQAYGRNAQSHHDFSLVFGWGNSSTAANQMNIGARHIEMRPSSIPSVPPSQGVRLASRVNSAGKTELYVQFPNGENIVVASET